MASEVLATLRTAGHVDTLSKRQRLSISKLPKELYAVLEKLVRSLNDSDEQVAMILRNAKFHLESIVWAGDHWHFRLVVKFASKAKETHAIYRLLAEDMANKQWRFQRPKYEGTVIYNTLQHVQIRTRTANAAAAALLLKRAAPSCNLRELRRAITPDMYARFDAAMEVLQPTGPERALAAGIEAIPKWVKQIPMPLDWARYQTVTPEEWLQFYGHSQNEEEMNRILQKLGPGYYYLRLGSDPNSLTAVSSSKGPYKVLLQPKTGDFYTTENTLIGTLKSFRLRLDGGGYGKEISIRPHTFAAPAPLQ
jgi:hypothetical protein